MTAPACTHCGHSHSVPCPGCRQGGRCLGLCWACQVEADAALGADPFETDEVPRVRHHADGTVEVLGDLDLSDLPTPTATGFEGPPMDTDDIPF